jgi:hypothetical protein
MAFSDITQWASGLYARRVVVHNADGTIASFPSTAAAATGTTIRKWDKSAAGAAFNNVMLTAANPVAASVVNFETLRVENSFTIDVYCQIVVAANATDAAIAPAILDVFMVRAFSSRTVSKNEFAAVNIAVPIGSEVYLRFSQDPKAMFDYTPTGSECLNFLTVVNQL